MTPKERTQAISDLLETNIPALLTSAGLDDIAEYRNGSPLRADDNECCVYIDFDNNTTDMREFGVLIQIQLYAQDEADAYHDVIMPYIEKNLTSDVIGYQERTVLNADLWPMDSGAGNAFIFYEATFQDMIDDCFQDY